MNDREILMMSQLGQILGLHPDLIGQVASQGSRAVIDRVTYTDQTGAQSRVLALAQRVGIYMEDRILEGDPANSEDMLDAVANFANDLQIPPVLAVDLIGPVLEVFQRAVQMAARGGNSELLGSAEQESATGYGEPATANAGIRERTVRNGAAQGAA